MRFAVTAVTDADGMDFSDLTTARRIGPAQWAEDGSLEIPFDREPTPAEQAAITLRLTSSSVAQEQLRRAAATYAAMPNPSTADNTAQIKALTALVMDLLSREA